MANHSTGFKVLAALLLMSVASDAFAQPQSGFVKCDSHTVDVREFASSFRFESNQRVSLRAPERDRTPLDTIRWIDRINNLPDYLHEFYDRYCMLVQEVLEGGTNCLSDPDSDNINALHLSDNSCSMVITSITRKIVYTFPADVDYNDPYAKQQYALMAVNNDINENVLPLKEEVKTFIPYLFVSMNYDNPQAFWLGNNLNWGSSYNYSWNFMQCAAKDAVQYTFYILLNIKDSKYDFRIDQFRSANAVKDGVAEFKGLVSNILDSVPGVNRYDQVRYLNNWLTKHNSYSSAYGSGDFPLISWSPISALRGTAGDDGPVCEGYSRAFKVLCDRLNIPCILAVGNARQAVDATPEDHMWNEVKMDDGQWYAVDVTWNDPVVYNNTQRQSGYENEFWLLLGKNDIVAPNLTFLESHPNSISYGQDQMSKWDYDSATLIADNRYEASNGVIQVKESASVTVYSIVGTKIGTYGSMPEALSNLTSGIYIIDNHKVFKP